MSSAQPNARRHQPPPPSAAPPANTSNNDQAVIKTADDAILHKLSCVEKGYYVDPYIPFMAQDASGLVHKRKPMASRYPPPAGAGNASGTEPIIRRGTHARVKVIERAIDAFLSLPLSSSSTSTSTSTKSADINASMAPRRQIVILGAGRDTTYLRYRFGKKTDSSLDDGSTNNNIQWYEVDHSSVIQQKAHKWLHSGCIPSGYSYNCAVNRDTNCSFTVSIAPKKHNQKQQQQEQGMEDKNTNTTSSSTNYHLIGHDLRASPAALFDILCHSQHGYNRSNPTLFIFECVLMYLPDDATRTLLRYIAESPSPTAASSVSSQQQQKEHDPFVSVVLYDPIPSNDRFGQLMIENLHRAGIMGTKSQRRHVVHDTNATQQQQQDQQQQLLSLEKTCTLSDQLTKLIQCGFTKAVGCDMNTAYNHGVISNEDRRIASRCEMLDELEEFVLLMKHYCLVVGVASAGSASSAACSKSGKDNDSDDDLVGYQLCEVGKDSRMGFQEGRCMMMMNR